MDLEPLIMYIKICERALNNLLSKNNYSKIELRLRIGYYRCMARIKTTKIKGIDINKRCCKHIYKDNVCKLHWTHEVKLGFVNCIPTSDIIENYKNHKYSVNLNHTPFFSLNLKKKNTDIIKMSHTEFDYSICEDANGSPEEIYNEYIRCNKTGLSITIAEKKMILVEIEKQVELSKKTKLIIKKKKR